MLLGTLLFLLADFVLAVPPEHDLHTGTDLILYDCGDLTKADVDHLAAAKRFTGDDARSKECALTHRQKDAAKNPMRNTVDHAEP